MKQFKLPIAKDGFRFILPLAGLTCLFLYVGFFCLTAITGLVNLFVLYFFRDPERKASYDENTVISPADGKIVDIKHMPKQGDREEGVLISIFLSVFNVHINRIPYSGRVISTAYNPGKFLPAYRDKASDLNEQNSVVIENDNGVKITVKQIAGLIARRIVCWVKQGESIKTGERFGLIRFGSRVDLFVPKDTDLHIKIGDRVKGGETIIGWIG